MNKFFRDCFTCSDNQTFDVMRVLSVVAILVYFVCSLLTFVTVDEHWDAIQFAEGFGIIVVSVSASLRIKQDTEPKG